MLHLDGVFLWDVLLSPRVPAYCAVGSSLWLGSLGPILALGQTWAKNCLCGSQRPYRTVQKELYREGQGCGLWL